MSQISIWYERKFAFTFPVELFPDIRMRLRGTPARLEEIFRGLPDNRLINKPDGKWSAQEHAGHLFDLEPLWLARVEDFATSKTELTVADLTNRHTDEANYNVQSMDQILSNFRAARAQLLQHTDNLDKSLFGRTILHPRLKIPMRLVDHLYFVAEHDDHHLARIWELLHND